MNHPEHDEQVAVIHWARMMVGIYPCLAWLHAIPNGAKYGFDRRMAVIQSNYLKAEGLVPGICDLFLPWASRGWHGFYIELKAPGKLTEVRPGQSDFMAYAESAGYLAQVYDCALDTIEALEWYLSGKP